MRSPLFLFAVVAICACDAPPIEWADPVSAPARPQSRLVVDSAGRAGFVPDSSVAAAVNLPGLCPTSVRTARGSTQLRAVAWALRADSSAVLYMTASPDSGRTWGPSIAVDTADVSMRGCQRPAPSIAAFGDELHIAYSMVASEGTGVFFAHFLGSMIHSPVPVIYGDRLVPTAIAADSTRVAVAYEQPNGTRRRVEVALSSSQGHIFESHATASRDIDDATDPAVALAGERIAVAWSSRQTADSAATRVVRVGRIR